MGYFVILTRHITHRDDDIPVTNSSLTLYGIKNCDTVRKARKWLDAHGASHHYHDFRDDGLDLATIRRWLEAVGPEALVNRRSTTWKSLDDAARTQADGDQLPALLQANPTLIKRPVLEKGDQVLVGFTENTYSDIIS